MNVSDFICMLHEAGWHSRSDAQHEKIYALFQELQKGMNEEEGKVKEATHVATEIQGLTFSIGDDGVWMNTSSDGIHTSINLTNYAKEGGAITRGLLGWCKDLARRYADYDA